MKHRTSAQVVQSNFLQMMAGTTSTKYCLDKWKKKKGKDKRQAFLPAAQLPLQAAQGEHSTVLYKQPSKISAKKRGAAKATDWISSTHQAATKDQHYILVLHFSTDSTG